MNNILKYITPKQWGLIAVIGVLNVVQVWLNLRIPEYMAEITQLIQTPGSLMQDIYTAGEYMLICAFISLVMIVLICFLASRIAASVSQRIRGLMFERVDSFSMGDINKFSIASLITRSTNDVTQVQMVLTIGLQLIIFAPMLAAWAFAKIATRGFEWTLATGVAALFVVLLFVVVMLAVLPKFKIMQKLNDNVNDVARENLMGLPVVRAYNAEGYQEAKFEKANDELTATNLFTTRSMAVMMPLVGVIMNVLMLSIYWIGAVLINDAAPTEITPLFADMIVFSAYAMQVMLAFMMILMLFIFLPRAQVAARRIYEVIVTEPSIKDGTVDDPGNGLKGEIEFRNVSFKYPGAVDYVLKDVSFSAKRGETVAFIGSTGSGKSTLINLVPRFYDVTEGSVLVDGMDVREYKLETLYNKIGYIPQKSVLFTGTIESNVAFGDNGSAPPTEDDVRDAVKIAQGKKFVEKMDGGYDADVARGGTNLSGGQRQRLSIARAICRKPEIYIFDDSFSALDYKTDRTLRSALKKETAGVTSMIVAQRIGTIMDADKIVVLDEGRVVGEGRHKELLRTCAVYKEIAMSQLSAEELAI
ncbi:MAG: ABC transporter ATP-binding protein/permease [Candidatus Methanoplasma sp.]|jgi:ATP-binding cassette subfamily B protein|nr:ABC transporter ATP-binding protein/permease [Candidatus Methanoplasma sp.]